MFGLAKRALELGLLALALNTCRKIMVLEQRDQLGVRLIMLAAECRLALEAAEAADGEQRKAKCWSMVHHTLSSTYGSEDERLEDELTAPFLYTRALVAFIKEGAKGIVKEGEKSAKVALKLAMKRNSYVPAYLLGLKLLPRDLPYAYSLGSEEEAAYMVISTSMLLFSPSPSMPLAPFSQFLLRPSPRWKLLALCGSQLLGPWSGCNRDLDPCTYHNAAKLTAAAPLQAK
jgi:hypothetical protein